MHPLLVFCFFIVSLGAWSQDSIATIRIRKEKQVAAFTSFDRPAYFKDSLTQDGELIDDFVRNTTRVPEAVRKGEVSGTVYVRFTITEKGEITSIRIVKGVAGCPACDAEVLRTIGLMPRWHPAIVKNKPVASEYSMPVRFKSALVR